MNWNQLQYVIAIAEEKNYTRASEKLFISQPSLSQSIKSLEEELGIKIFERKNNAQELTYAGGIFYEWAWETLISQKLLFEQLTDVVNEKRQLLRIGISPYRSKILMPSILKRFYAVYPDCEVALTELPTYEMKEMLESDELDLILDTPHPDSNQFQSEILLNEKIMLGVPESYLSKIGQGVENADSPEALNGIGETDGKTEYIDLQDLKDCNFILQSSSQVIGIIARNICEKQHFQPQTRLMCTSAENALCLCSQQMGIVFVPELLTKKEEYKGKIRFFSIRNAEDYREICLVYPKKKYINRPMGLMLHLFREEMKELT